MDIHDLTRALNRRNSSKIVLIVADGSAAFRRICH